MCITIFLGAYSFIPLLMQMRLMGSSLEVDIYIYFKTGPLSFIGEDGPQKFIKCKGPEILLWHMLRSELPPNGGEKKSKGSRKSPGYALLGDGKNGWTTPASIEPSLIPKLQLI